MKKLTFLLSFYLCVGCSHHQRLSADELKSYEGEINAWHAKRIEEVKAPNGWLNLVGLHWLEPGINPFGSDEKNTIVFPKNKIAPRAGYFLLKDNVVTLVVNPDVSITANGKAVTSQVIFHPDSTQPILLSSGTLRWNIIRRESKFGIRLRDDESSLAKEFTGIDRFPINPNFRADARFEESDSSKTIDITNAIGQTTAQPSPGTLVFKLGEKEFRLDALEGNKDEFFVVFGDETSGNETYGGGRFLYVKRPDANGNTVVDFNKAYNPPCVFTPYATCPLPPKQNVLAIKITAGEKVYGRHNTTASLKP